MWSPKPASWLQDEFDEIKLHFCCTWMQAGSHVFMKTYSALEFRICRGFWKKFAQPLNCTQAALQAKIEQAGQCNDAGDKLVQAVQHMHVHCLNNKCRNHQAGHFSLSSAPHVFMQSLGSTVADAMIAATSATRTDLPKVSTDPATSYSDVGLPSSAVTAMQAAPLCVLDMLLNEDKHWMEFGLRAFAVGMRTLSHAVCMTLARRDSCKDSTYSSQDSPEDLCCADLVPHLNMTLKTMQLSFSAHRAPMLKARLLA